MINLQKKKIYRINLKKNSQLDLLDLFKAMDTKLLHEIQY